MAFTKRKGIIIFIVVAVVIIAAVLVYVFRCKLFPALGSCVQDPNKNNTPIPPGSPTPKWVPEKPPYNVGMFGPKIKALQTALGISADGQFGQQTKAAVIAKGKVVPLSEVDYNILVNPNASGGGSNYEKLKKALGSKAIPYSDGVYVDMKGENKNYVFSFYPDGRFFFSLPKVQTTIAEGTYSDGGKSMKINGDWTAYTEDTVFKNMLLITAAKGE